MDNLTHTLTGLALARLAPEKLRRQALWVCLLAANAPDADVFWGAFGSLSYLDHHRGITHALAAAPLMAFLALLPAWWLGRKKASFAWLPLGGMALAGVLSHLLLDWTNFYGIRLLLPFSSEWLRLDQTYVVDVWILLALILASAAPVIGRLVGSEMGAAPKPPRGWALFVLAFLLLYNGGRFVLHGRATAMLESRIYDGAAPLRTAAMGDAVSLFRWRGIVETESAFYVYSMDLTREFDPSAGRVLAKPEASAALEAARRHPVFAEFARFLQIPYYRVAPASGGGFLVWVNDLRFGDPGSGAFEAEARVEESGRVKEASIVLGAPRMSR